MTSYDVITRDSGVYKGSFEEDFFIRCYNYNMESSKKKQKMERTIFAEFPLGQNVKCCVESGDYNGPIIRLMRGTRWIAFSHNQWRMIVKQDIDKEVDLKLSEGKDMKAIAFNDKRYISFHRIYRANQCIYDTYINLNKEEWELLMQINPAIMMELPKCCTKQKKKLIRGRMLETKLSPEHLKDVKESNEEAYNQLAYCCEYCGVQFDYEGTCHCHRYNCRECEPDNFCKHCGDVTVESI